MLRISIPAKRFDTRAAVGANTTTCVLIKMVLSDTTNDGIETLDGFHLASGDRGEKNPEDDVVKSLRKGDVGYWVGKVFH